MLLDVLQVCIARGQSSRRPVLFVAALPDAQHAVGGAWRLLGLLVNVDGGLRASAHCGVAVYLRDLPPTAQGELRNSCFASRLSENEDTHKMSVLIRAVRLSPVQDALGQHNG